MNSNLYVDVHILQDIPPANLNRDDSGSPKTARYGGVDRLRVSSQAWKRATRKHFASEMEPTTLGFRTRRVTETVVNTLIERGVSADASLAIANQLLTQIKITASKKKENESSYLLFLSLPQLQELADQVFEQPELWDSPVELGKTINVARTLGEGHSLDVALFGRMVADLSEINVDAACQVSHVLGTHAAPTQFDYFTAVDDAQGASEAGAGMIGTVEFNASTVYRYATVNVPALISNMSDQEQAVLGVRQFLRSFVLSMPTGKQNTFAAHTRPGLVWVTIRTDQPVNYVSAFEKPVQADGQGYLGGSVQALAHFVAEQTKRWGDDPRLSIATYDADFDVLEDVFGGSVSFEELLNQVVTQLEHELPRDATDE